MSPNRQALSGLERVPVWRNSSADLAATARSAPWLEAEDAVVQEQPVALEYNGIAHAVMMLTPTDLEDFALGFSLTEGLIERPEQLLDCEVVASPSGLTLQLAVTAACFARFKDQRRAMTGRTGCGLCGATSLDQAMRVLPALPTEGVPAFPLSALLAAMANLRASQVLLAASGAGHAAAWCDAQGQIQCVREDVGRHNALDKLIGALAHQTGLDAARGAILVSSRASHEMVQKTAAAGVPVLAAVSGVTSLAIDTAQRTGLGLAGFVRAQNLGVYTHPARFLNEF